MQIINGIWFFCTFPFLHFSYKVVFFCRKPKYHTWNKKASQWSLDTGRMEVYKLYLSFKFNKLPGHLGHTHKSSNWLISWWIWIICSAMRIKSSTFWNNSLVKKCVHVWSSIFNDLFYSLVRFVIGQGSKQISRNF